VDSVELEPGIRLRRATHNEQVQAEEGSFSFPMLPGAESRIFSSPGFFVGLPDYDQLPYVLLEIEDHPSLPRYHVQVDKPWPFVEQLLFLLRLLDHHQVAVHSTWYVDTNPFHYGMVPRQPHDEPMPRDHRAGPYTITAEIAARLQTLWPKADRAMSNPRLVLAIGRLGDSYARKKPEDKLVDYWIALETLFATDATQELKYRVSLRIARFIGKTTQQRQALFQEIKRSYDQRSDVVHGGDPASKRRQRLPDVVQQTGTTLRIVLLQCVEQGEPPRLQNIDDEMLA
jgi:hypothetical protein